MLAVIAAVGGPGHAGAASVVTGQPVAPAARALALRAPAGWALRATGVACIGPGSCALAGDAVVNGSQQGRTRLKSWVAVERHGAWGPITSPRLPADAADLGDYHTVACAGPQSCVAAGSYVDHRGDGQPMVDAGGLSGWRAAGRVLLPHGARQSIEGQASWLASISCPAAGECAAVGRYVDTTGATQAMIAPEARGAWKPARTIVLPADADRARGRQKASLDAVSCTSVGMCLAAGQYLASGGRARVMVAVERHGSWGRARPVAAPAGTVPTAAACTAPGTCVAVGAFPAGRKEHALILTETNGAWARALSPSLGELDAVACLHAGVCVAVGDRFTVKGNTAPTAVVERGRRWGAVTTVTLPAGAAASQLNGTRLSSVSCAPIGGCLAVGRYNRKHGGDQIMAVSLFV